MRTSGSWIRILAKFGILGCLYFAQGLPYGFFTQALPVIMRDRGASLPQIGLASLLVLPWALKFLWAPLVDRFGWSRIGIKKTWLLGLQFLGIVLFITLGTIEETDSYAYLIWGFFFANLIAATQDIASDGLAVTMLTPEERGLGNGLQVAGYRLGMFFGGGFLLIYFSYLHWRGAFLFIGISIFLTTLPVLFYGEPPAPPVEDRLGPKKLLGRFLKRNGVFPWLAVIGFYKFGDAMTTPMLRPFFRDRGLELEEIGKLLGTAGFISGLVGALIGGSLVFFFRRYWAIVWFGVIQAVAVFGYYLLGIGFLDDNALYFLCSLEHFTGGMATAAIFTAMMDICRLDSGATDYTVQASFVVIATATAGVVGGFVSGHLGYNGNFLLSTLLSFAGTFLFAWKYKHRARDLGPMAL